MQKMQRKQLEKWMAGNINSISHMFISFQESKKNTGSIPFKQNFTCQIQSILRAKTKDKGLNVHIKKVTFLSIFCISMILYCIVRFKLLASQSIREAGLVLAKSLSVALMGLIIICSMCINSISHLVVGQRTNLIIGL